MSVSHSEAPVPFVDARCGCSSCVTRTKDVYRMIGHCANCGTEPILVLYRKGDQAALKDCPVCGCWHAVQADRLATPDEIPTESGA